MKELKHFLRQYPIFLRLFKVAVFEKNPNKSLFLVLTQDMSIFSETFTRVCAGNAQKLVIFIHVREQLFHNNKSCFTNSVFQFDFSKAYAVIHMIF